jgi:hypothetical protein
MFHRITHDNRHLNISSVSLAAGVALTGAVIIGSIGVLWDKSDTKTASAPIPAIAKSVGPVMQEPDFGSVAADYWAFRQPGAAMAEPDFGSVAADYSAFPRVDSARMPGTDALGRTDESPAVVDPYFGTGAESVSAIEGDDLSAIESPTVVDPYFGTGAESVSAIEGDDLP